MKSDLLKMKTSMFCTKQKYGCRQNIRITQICYTALPKVDGGLYEKRLITLRGRPVMEAVFWLNPDLVLYLVL
jgi:hypothetical protein